MAAGRDRSTRPKAAGKESSEGELSTGDLPTDGRGHPQPGAEITAPLDEPALPRRDRPKDEQRRVAPDPEVGERVGRYLLVERLGKGGAGSVFRAEREDDGQVVALKVLSASRAKRARIVQRFFDEVRTASLVQHRGLIRVLDFIEEEDPRRLAYAMEYLQGETLRERLKREGALDLRDAIRVGVEVAEALFALHASGIIHRDLKPENIMILAGGTVGATRVKLLDFGVVKFLPVDKTGGALASTEEKAGTFVGTPRYMAPEQAAGGAIDTRADLFALGVVLFEMITGACPHEGDSLRDVVLAKLKGAPRIKVNPGKEILPAELTELVDACLQLKPAGRPKTAREVANGLSAAEVVLFAVGSIKADASGSHVRVSAELPAGPEGSGPKRPPPREAPEPSEPKGKAPAQVEVTVPRATEPMLLAREDPLVAPGEVGDGRGLKALILLFAALFLVLAGVLAYLRFGAEETVLVLPPDEPTKVKPEGKVGSQSSTQAATGSAARGR